MKYTRYKFFRTLGMAVCLLVQLSSGTAFGGTISTRTVSEYFYYETYGRDSLGLDATLGYQYCNFFNENWGFAIAVTGAILGDRGGYGTASVGLAHRLALPMGYYWNTRIFIGSGGGHALPCAGGFVANVQTGVSLQILPGTALHLHTGYLDFIQGTFKRPYFNAGISFQFLEPVLD